ncbi:ExbD/TolR family protein [Tropicibacter alexandrii]|uniref:ExbD/TolR family protein n=1 Tax=Tropicibacter alexandrii TaxID=2267683 RepID=UPI000EF4DF5F|nr:biopolymer transporter ExbD [Tropicibacter alexandrii]
MARRALLPPRPTRQPPDTSLAIVNIVLLLIFFFLATGSMTATPQHTLALSQTADLPIEQLPKPILIVEEGDVISIDGEPVAPELLGSAVQDMTVLHVLSDREARAGILLDLLARPELSTLEVRLVTIHRSGEE